MLDRALAELRRGAATDALRILDRYDREFPRGALQPEATAARVEALMAKGDRARAKAIAEQFLAAHPDSPLAHRVRATIAR